MHGSFVFRDRFSWSALEPLGRAPEWASSAGGCRGRARRAARL